MGTLPIELHELIEHLLTASGMGLAFAAIAAIAAIVGLAYKIIYDKRAKTLVLEVAIQWVVDESKTPTTYSMGLHISNLSNFPVTIQTVEFEPLREGRVKYLRYIDLSDTLPLRLEPRDGRTWEVPITEEINCLLRQAIVYNQKIAVIIRTTANEEFRMEVEITISGIVGEGGYFKRVMEMARQMED